MLTRGPEAKERIRSRRLTGHPEILDCDWSNRKPAQMRALRWNILPPYLVFCEILSQLKLTFIPGRANAPRVPSLHQTLG
jgi:hypothetical protein